MYCAYITTIKELRKHSNADRLQCATIFGNNVIVDLSYQAGQRVIYFPVDGQLGEDFAKENNLVRVKDAEGNNTGGYLDPDKRNITALKLRGEQSDGLVLPLEVLSKYTDIEKLTDGEQITTLNGYEICRKYIPRSNRQIKDKTTRQYKTVSGTRRVTLRDYGDGGWYGSNAFREKYHNFFRDRLPKGVEIFYEIVGWVNENSTIMGRCSNKLIKDKEFQKQYGDETVFSYGCEVGQNDCYVYRMTLTNEDGFTVEVPWEQVLIECEKMGVKCVPTFEKFTYTTWEDLMSRVEKYYDGADPIGRSHIREGVVVRIDNRPSFTAYKHKNFYFKCLSGIMVDSLSEEQIANMSEDVISEM